MLSITKESYWRWDNDKSLDVYTGFLAMYLNKALWNLNIPFSIMRIILRQNMFLLIDNFLLYRQKEYIKKRKNKVLIVLMCMRDIHKILFIRKSHLLECDLRQHILHCGCIFHICLLLVYFFQIIFALVEFFLLLFLLHAEFNRHPSEGL